MCSDRVDAKANGSLFQDQQAQNNTKDAKEIILSLAMMRTFQPGEGARENSNAAINLTFV